MFGLKKDQFDSMMKKNHKKNTSMNVHTEHL